MSDVSGDESQRLIEPRLTENEKKIIKNAANCKSFTAHTRAFAAVIENVSMQFKNNVLHVEIENLKNYNFVLVEVKIFTKQNKLKFFVDLCSNLYSALQCASHGILRFRSCVTHKFFFLETPTLSFMLILKSC